MDPQEKTQTQGKKNDNIASPYGIVNVKEMKKEPKKPQRDDEHLWYNQIKYWIAIPLIPSIIALVIGYFYRSFLLLAVIFPLVGIASWYVRKIFRDKELDKEEWLK